MNFSKRNKKTLEITDGKEAMVHSMESCNFLKLEDSNTLSFVREGSSFDIKV
jgi:hypothetical protein